MSERGPGPLDRHGAIDQRLDSGRFEGPFRTLGIDKVIMVAENAPHPHRSGDSREAFDEALSVGVSSVHLIAGEDDEIGIEPIRHIPQPRHAVRIHVGAGVNVGDLQDLEPVPRRGKIRKVETLPTHAGQIESVRESISAEAHRAGSGQTGIFEEFSSGKHFPGALRRPRSPRRHGMFDLL